MYNNNRMVSNNSDLLASYEKDFKECVSLLKEIVEDVDPASRLDKNSFALDNANKLLKQMEVEAMNFMEDDSVRRRVSLLNVHLAACSLWANTGKFRDISDSDSYPLHCYLLTYF